MKFLDTMEFVKKLKENENKIVIAKCGVFMQAIGSDAILINEIFGFKLICIKPGVCKIGIPTSDLIRCLNTLDKLGIGYSVYDYKKETKEMTLKYTMKGKNILDRSKHLECEKCDYYKEHYKSSYESINIFEILKQREKEEDNYE